MTGAYPRWVGLAGVVVLIVVVLAIGVAFVGVVGSPVEARKRHADVKREEAIEQIVISVRNYYHDHHELPNTLATLTLTPLDMQDPETRETFAYRVVDAKRFELCGVFSTDSTTGDQAYERDYEYNDGSSSQIEQHVVGRNCYKFDAKH